MSELEPTDPSAEGEENEPTVQELANALKDVLSPEDCQELLGMDFADALGYAYTLLIENGIEDPDGFLAEKGILSNPELNE